MKRALIAVCMIMSAASCKRMSADYESRSTGVRKVCPTCTFVTSEREYYAQDTSKRPNIIYKVYFKDGMFFYDASTVDHLIRIN